MMEREKMDSGSSSFQHLSLWAPLPRIRALCDIRTVPVQQRSREARVRGRPSKTLTLTLSRKRERGQKLSRCSWPAWASHS